MQKPLLEQAVISRALNSAAAILARRDHSRNELKAKLCKRGFDTATAQAVVDRCEHLGYIDEEGSARRFARSRSSRGYGPGHIRQAMKKHGYGDTLIHEVLAPYRNETRQAEGARLALKKKLKTIRSGQDPRCRKEKLYRFLCNRGFSPQVVRHLLLDEKEGTGLNP